MNIFTALLLGTIQGFTEFLPVSSSGHLVIVQSLIPGFSQPGVLFDTMLHAGTLLAVIFYFRNRILTLSKEEIILLAIGTIPAALAGVFLSDFLESRFSDVRSVGIELIITGLLCYAIDKEKNLKKEHIKPLDAFLVGIGQAIAIIPGISRSGATIFTATKRGISRQRAAEFSFLLSIPAVGGAIALQLLKYGLSDSISPAFYSIGFVASLIFGFLSIKILLRFLVEKRFKYFAYYCFALGGIVFFL